MTSSKAELSLERCLEWHRRRGSERLALALLREVDSTNSLARRIARAYLNNGGPAPLAAVIARCQSAGRGRRGRRWSSPAGQGIYASLLLPVADAEALAALPLRVPLGLCEELDELGLGCRIKWPNDLMVAGRKLGGVLIESVAGGMAIIGYGINGLQNVADLPVPGSTSLRLAVGRETDLSRLAVDLVESLARRLIASEPLAAVVAAYAARSAHRAGEALSCRLGDERLEGRFAGFDERGRLRLATAGGERLLASAELLAEETVAGDAAALPEEGR